MKNDQATKVETKKKLVLRRETIRGLDRVDLTLVAGGLIAAGSADSCTCPPNNHV